MRKACSEHLQFSVWLTKQLDSSSQAIDVNERPEGLGGAHAAEE